MKSPFTSKYHPDNQALLGYAESLVDSQALLNTEVFSHIQTCESCMAKVQEIRKSLVVVNEVDDIEPTGDLTASIMMAAKQSPRTTTKLRSWARTGALAASALFIATFGLGYINQQQPAVQPTPTQETATLQKIELEAEAAKTIEEMTKRYEPVAQSTPVEKLVAPAVKASSVYPMTEQEREQMRALEVYGEDIDMARQALERNPGLVRAYDTIVTTQEVRDDTYLKVYMEDSQ